MVLFLLVKRSVLKSFSLMNSSISVPMKMRIHPPRRWKRSRASCSPIA